MSSRSPISCRLVLERWAVVFATLTLACADAVYVADAGLDAGPEFSVPRAVEFGVPGPDTGCGVERCNGQDDDCDGETDEGFPVGEVCEARSGSCVLLGAFVCAADSDQATCLAEPGQSNGQMELCNQVDDDCDGSIDEGLPENCDECVPGDEICNGVDDDCDQTIDEGVLNACGECGEEPVEECDGVDQDCDGNVDEGVVNACGGCGPVADESCNGEDDDCDGLIDEESDCGCPISRVDDHPYLLCGDQANWNTARQRCQERGYDLVVLKDAEEDAAVFAAIRAAGLGDTWIGLNDRDEEGNWQWVDGSPLNRGVDHENWARGEPNNSDNEDCILYIVGGDRNSDWDDRPCGRDYDFVCEAPR